MPPKDYGAEWRPTPRRRWPTPEERLVRSLGEIALIALGVVLMLDVLVEVVRSW